MITRLRVMTRKSIIGFGRYPDYRIDDFFKMYKTWDLVSMYYKLSAVSFSDDVLNDLMITEERRIEKPGISPDAYREHAEAILLDMKAEQNEKEIMGLASSRKKCNRIWGNAITNQIHNKQRNKNRNQGYKR